MSPITTHVLDTRLGQPARELAITLSKQENSAWQELASGVTNDDGRITDLLEKGSLELGIYQLKSEKIDICRFSCSNIIRRGN